MVLRVVCIEEGGEDLAELPGAIKFLHLSHRALGELRKGDLGKSKPFVQGLEDLPLNGSDVGPGKSESFGDGLESLMKL
jgi:hypothetical protein